MVFLGTFAVTLYALAPRLFPNQPGVRLVSLVSIGVVGAWLAGFALFAGPTWRLHAEMVRQKRHRCEELRRQLVEYGLSADPFPDVEDISVDPDEILPYLYLERSLRRAELTREYPTNAALLRDVCVSSVPSIATYVAAFVVAGIRL